jgi:lysophospholipase L1-like esterase
MHQLPIRSIAVRTLTVVLFAAMAVGWAGEPPADIAGKRILVLGDSITQDGTWVSFLAYRMAKARGAVPDLISIGLASETASGLSEQDHPFPRPCIHERLGRALALVKPQVVVACYGMNDGIYHPPEDGRMAAFQQGIQRLLVACSEQGAGVILLTPPPFDPQPVRAKLRPAGSADFGYKAPYEGYAAVLSAFSSWQLTLPAQQALVIDLNGPLTAHVAQRRMADPAFALSGDGIHPSRVGHLLMADLVCAGLDPSLVPGGPGSELAVIEADPLFAAVKRWREVRSKGWLDHVGYTRGETVRRATIDDVEQTAAGLAQQVAKILERPAP